MYLIYYSKANSANMQAVFPPGRKNSFVKLVIIQLHGSDSKEELLKDHREKKRNTIEISTVLQFIWAARKRSA